MSEYSQFLKRENARLKEENERLRDEVLSLRQYIDSLQILLNATYEIDPSDEILSLLDRILYNALMVINAADGSLLVLDEDTDELVFIISHGSVDSRALVGHRIPAGKGVAGWVASTGEAVIVNNTASDDRFYAGVDTTFAHETRSILAAPISGGGKVLGVLEVLNKHNGLPFNEADKNLLTLLCRFAGEILHVMLQEEDKDDTEEAA